MLAISLNITGSNTLKFNIQSTILLMKLGPRYLNYLQDNRKLYMKSGIFWFTQDFKGIQCHELISTNSMGNARLIRKNLIQQAMQNLLCCYSVNRKLAIRYGAFPPIAIRLEDLWLDEPIFPLHESEINK